MYLTTNHAHQNCDQENQRECEARQHGGSIRFLWLVVIRREDAHRTPTSVINVQNRNVNRTSAFRDAV